MVRRAHSMLRSTSCCRHLVDCEVITRPCLLPPLFFSSSPDKMESRDGFLTTTRRRIEAAVATNGEPGIMVAHSMGNLIFRYYWNGCEWKCKKKRIENMSNAPRNEPMLQYSLLADIAGRFMFRWNNNDCVADFADDYLWVSMNKSRNAICLLSFQWDRIVDILDL